MYEKLFKVRWCFCTIVRAHRDHTMFLSDHPVTLVYRLSPILIHKDDGLYLIVTSIVLNPK